MARPDLTLADLITRLGDAVAGLEDVRRESNLIQEAVKSVAMASSGSWIGYHSRVYYRGLVEPASGTSFNPDVGLVGGYRGRPNPDWEEFTQSDIQQAIFSRSEVENLETITHSASILTKEFQDVRGFAISVLSALSKEEDSFVHGLIERVTDGKITARSDIVQGLSPSRYVTSDAKAGSQGIQVPPHIRILATALWFDSAFNSIEELSIELQAASTYFSTKSDSGSQMKAGDRVFIGHGRSSDWRELKDFISDRLKLPHEEFNRVPVAGLSNSTRLLDMLNNAAIAFLVLTGEDESTDGEKYPRMNVVHEAGLFQGRLGFSKAILLLEDGCSEFSNIQGLGQIRFPKGNISSCFESIRTVLERENIIE